MQAPDSIVHGLKPRSSTVYILAGLTGMHHVRAPQSVIRWKCQDFICLKCRLAMMPGNLMPSSNWLLA